ncbi:hypothetical protein [Bacillus rhizoplanae]|uniref:hypothetical protein n=1 Tax=Bacillus rhizoplanae TaxID=2880966 RepID=UPI003D2354C9
MLKIKSGKYGIYKGKEYRLAKEKDDSITLVSEDPAELQNGFIKYERSNNIFLKVVLKQDLESAYYINVDAKYKGHIFGVIGYGEKDQTVTLFTQDPALADKFHMSRPFRGEFVKIVKVDEVELIENKKPIWGFE